MEPEGAANLVFPPDRFPSFSSSSQDQLNAPQEEFGPPLSCDPTSRLYVDNGLKIWQPGHVFSPQGPERDGNIMEVLFNAVDNAYLQPRLPNTGPGKTAPNGWHCCAWRYCNIAHVLERDWKMAYLTRENIQVTPKGNILDGFIEYRFDLRGAGKKVKKLSLRLPCTNFRDGRVRVLVCSREDYTVLLDTQRTTEVFRAQGWDDFIIRAELSGKEQLGHFVTTYQNAQIFRQPFALPQWGNQSVWNSSFHVVIEMQDADITT